MEQSCFFKGLWKVKKEEQVAANMCRTSSGQDRYPMVMTDRETHPVSRLALPQCLLRAQKSEHLAAFSQRLFLEHALAPAWTWSRALFWIAVILKSALQVLRIKAEKARRSVGRTNDEKSFCVLSICNGLPSIFKLLGLKYLAGHNY